MVWVNKVKTLFFKTASSVAIGLAILFAACYVIFSSLVYFPIHSLNYERIVSNEIESLSNFWQSSPRNKTKDSADQLESDRKQMRQIGKGLVDNHFIIGGAAFEKNGEVFAVFGSKPSLTLDIAKADQVGRLLYNQDRWLDLHLMADFNAYGKDVIVTMDHKHLMDQAKKASTQSMMLVFSYFGMTTLLYYGITLFYLIGPLKKLSQDSYNSFDLVDLQENRYDEIAKIARIIELSKASLAHFDNDNLASFFRLNELQSFPCFSYNSDCKLVHMNRAAMEMFGVKTLEEAQTLSKDILVIASHADGKKYRTNAQNYLANGNRLTECEIDIGGNLVGGLVDGVALTNPTGDVIRYVLTVVTLDTVATRLSVLTEKNTRLLKEISTFDTRQMEMKQLLEACLCLLSPGQPADEESPTFEHSLMPDRIVNEWYEEAKKAKLVSGRLEHNTLTLLRGDKDYIRDVFRQALLLVYARTRVDRPTLAIGASLEGGKAVFNLYDISSQRAGGGAERKKNVDWNLPYAALMKALMRAGGTFQTLSGDNEASSVRFSMPASYQQEMHVTLAVAHA